MREQKRVLAMGFFDGVHLGHAALLERTKLLAKEQGLMPSVLTFDQHPDTLVFGKEVPLINSAAGREEIIHRCFGIENVVFIHFDRRMMQMEWRDFLDSVVRELQVAHFVVGHDFCFGYRGQGNAERLKGYSCEHGLGCDVIPPVMLDGQIVSSTHIRELIRDGRVDEARRWLGRPHTLTDIVRSGYHLGRRLGSPTINMEIPGGVIVPRFGVYATKVYLDNGELWPAVTNIGVRPTVSQEGRVTVESHLIDYQGDLYGHRARVEFYRFLRSEIRFADRAALSDQIAKDEEDAKGYFAQEEPNSTAG
ncbi:MAG: riboflavin biosynthesis protein RibF [Oscillospiraceae bacterium]|nr:riboflavin biosynthesis protein RibF [Oscillospiraceae bacterium]